MPLLAILGKTPTLSIAELESLFGANALRPAGYEAAVLDIEQNQLQPDNLGGVQKFGEIITTLPTTDWQKIRKTITHDVLSFTNLQQGSKVKFGISVYNFGINPAEINATGLSFKKALKTHGFSTRVIANKSRELNSAQVIHGGLLSQSGTELLILRDNQETIIAKTFHVQNIDAYAARDQARPMRDSRVGMLPPKLAQIIINLANPNEKSTILDPFCGTGVLLQEALLMNFQVVGTDLEPRMIEYSQKNLEWLANSHNFRPHDFTLEVADATSHRWKVPFNTIASETYLGRAMVSLPDQETLNKIVRDCETIHKKFLQNVARQTQPGFRMCIAVPAWRTKNSFRRLPLLDYLDDLGYNRMSFVHSEDSELLYHRKDQTVARELVVLIRK